MYPWSLSWKTIENCEMISAQLLVQKLTPIFTGLYYPKDPYNKNMISFQMLQWKDESESVI